VDHHDGVVEVQCHDLELDAPIVFADPDETSVSGSGRRHVVGHDGVDHELRMGLADAVASRRAIPPKRSVRILVWHRNTIEGVPVEDRLSAIGYRYKAHPEREPGPRGPAAEAQPLLGLTIELLVLVGGLGDGLDGGQRPGQAEAGRARLVGHRDRVG